MNTSLNLVRRRDRDVNDEAWIKQFLNDAPYGVLATEQEGQPFINPNLFVYDEERHALYLHTADQGRTVENVRANNRVCFTTFRMGRLLPSSTAREFSVEYESVVVFGLATILSGESERKHGLQCLMDKYFSHLHPGEHYPPINERDMRGVAVYRIDIQSWSGKRKQAAEDFPGAFKFKAEAW
jgi:nitroimidazol reductase NimA-like FMN-containing flavoprotein (pyridoxamine 5'-phosphate oxidase superfamily)